MGIAVSQLSKVYGGSPVLDRVSVDIETGELHTLLGPSGCGKTTLLRLIAGLETPYGGSIKLDGVDIGALPPRARPVNTVFQSYGLFPHLTAGANVAFGLRMLRWSSARIAARVRDMLCLVRLDSLADRYPAQLSGGQQQRIALARALAPEPKVLLLDEPLSALDFQLRKDMQAELKRLHAETGVTFVLVTHDREEALALSTRISVMKDGRIVQTGTPLEVYLKPETSFVARFVGDANLLRPARGAGTLAVRPDRTRLLPAGQGRIPATVLDTTFVGDSTVVRLTTDRDATVSARTGLLTDLKKGDRVDLGWADEDAVEVAV